VELNTINIKYLLLKVALNTRNHQIFIVESGVKHQKPSNIYCCIVVYPGGRKPKYFENENTAQLSTVTSTLLLNVSKI
jgi:hypothetical protein